VSSIGRGKCFLYLLFTLGENAASHQMRRCDSVDNSPSGIGTTNRPARSVGGRLRCCVPVHYAAALVQFVVIILPPHHG